MKNVHKHNSCFEKDVHNVDGIECLYTNTDVLNNKLEEIMVFIDKRNIHFIAITEIMPKNRGHDGDFKPDFVIPGFTSLCSYEGRGVALFVKETLDHVVLTEYDDIHSPSIVCRVKLPNKEHLIIVVCYRSPNSTDIMNDNVNTLINHVSKKHCKDKIIIMGDFNFPEIDWVKEMCDKSESHRASKFLSCVHKNYFYQHVKHPTHHRGNQNATLLDLVITNDEDLVQDIDYHPPLGSSHHSVLTFTIDVKPLIDKPVTSVPKSQFHKGDYENMRIYMTKEKEDWDELLKEDGSLDDWDAALVKAIETAADIYIPKKSFNSSQPVKRNFYAPETLLLNLQMKRKAFKQYTKHPTPTNYKQYTYYRNKVNTGVKKAKRMKELQVAREAKLNPKVLFQYVSSKNKTKEKIPDLDKDDGTKTTNDEEKVNLLSNYFASVYTTEDKTNIPEFQAQVGTKLANIQLTEEQVCKALKALNPTKSPGPDGVHPKVLKELAEQLQYPLYKLFNRSLKEGKIPTRWKEAEVRPIFKKGKKTAPGNYRPVSLTSVMCKVLEGFIRHAMYDHLVSNNLLAKEQFGFCKGRTCVSQLLVTLSEWLSDLDNKVPVDAAYLDFRKAFDSVPHERLMTKLKGYGITGNIFNWVKDFLSDRTQYVSINGVRSEKGLVTSGVPQGSVLGPTLFIYFINDLPTVTSCPNKIFADDTKAHKGIKTMDDNELLQNAINAMVDWSLKWQLGFNGDKCAMLHIGRNNPMHKYKIRHGNEKIIDIEDRSYLILKSLHAKRT